MAAVAQSNRPAHRINSGRAQRGARRGSDNEHSHQSSGEQSSDTTRMMQMGGYQQARKSGVRARKQGRGGYRGRGASSSEAASSGTESTAPWFKIMNVPSEAVASVPLGDEVLYFGNFMSLTPGEKATRNMMKSAITDAAVSVWPACTGRVYGSFAYNLSLPASDVDLIMEDCGDDLHDHFPLFVEALLGAGYEVIGEIQGAFLKVKNQKTKIGVNITFTEGKSPVRTSVAVIKQALHNFPMASSVVMVIRTVLSQCNLIDVPSGGISSFAIIIMVLAMCQEHPDIASDAGALLKEFLRHFGSTFDFSRHSIKMYVDEETCPNGMSMFQRPEGGALMWICDPLDPNNNVAEQCTKLAHLKGMWNYCYMALSKWEPAAPDSSAFRGRTALSTIIAHNALWARLGKLQPHNEMAAASLP
eukprot:TRINITY_DN2896_c0_g1_i1.p1 TRINITY_DN2896_c0_g1~~TRINITY_DN2896_c0_g1_i1.p1  ORF type:complete len:417 (+),score=151.83 TRINITY_DN2896_c0_g1_i1:62-1312(+)